MHNKSARPARISGRGVVAGGVTLASAAAQTYFKVSAPKSALTPNFCSDPEFLGREFLMAVS
jgi:hypothetical protein